MSIRIRNHNHNCQPSHSEITRNPTTIVKKLRLQLRKPSVQTPQTKGENACHIILMEPTKQRLQSSSVCHFAVVFVVFSDSFPNFTPTYLITYLLSYKALTMCSLFLRNCKHKKSIYPHIKGHLHIVNKFYIDKYYFKLKGIGFICRSILNRTIKVPSNLVP